MTDLLPTSPSPPLLPPMPARGAGAPLPTTEDFKALLASQGLKSSGGVPSEDEARIAAAQIAAKAEVNARVKRDPVVAGMNTSAAAPISTPAGRFMPLRQGPSAARTFSGTNEQSGDNTLAGLRATSKFPPGPVRPTIFPASVPAAGHAAPAQSASKAETAAPAVSAPKVVEAYNFGLRNAGKSERAATQEVPEWFGGAMEAGLQKYEAMKRTAP